MARAATDDRDSIDALLAVDDLIAGRRPSPTHVTALESFLWSLLPPPDPTPGSRPNVDDPLTRIYQDLTADGGSG